MGKLDSTGLAELVDKIKEKFKGKQTAVSDPSASGNSITFISSISQNTDGVINPQKQTVSTMTGATASAAGSVGLVPAPPSGDETSFLRSDGQWAKPTNFTWGMLYDTTQ